MIDPEHAVFQQEWNEIDFVISLNFQSFSDSIFLANLFVKKYLFNSNLVFFFMYSSSRQFTLSFHTKNADSRICVEQNLAFYKNRSLDCENLKTFRTH